MKTAIFFRLIFSIFVAGSSLLATDFQATHKKSVIDRIIITCYGGASQEIALFMGADKIVALPSSERFNHFLNLYPQLRDISSVGTFSDVNLETLLLLKPDIVFAGVTSTKTNERIEALGVPLFTLGIGRHSIETLLKEFEDVGTILNRKEKAALLIAYWREHLALIKERVSSIDSVDLRRVFYSKGSNRVSTENRKWWGDEFIRASGGINVASQMPIKGDVSPETLTLWNPDVIITSTNKSQKTSPQEMLKNPLFKNLKATKNREIYTSPTGAFWWDRPSPESILGILWLSKILYPKLMSDIDLQAKTQEFYRLFYEYQLSKSEYDSFFL